MMKVAQEGLWWQFLEESYVQLLVAADDVDKCIGQLYD